MTLAPCAVIVAPPALLPVFDDAWKARCRSCRHHYDRDPMVPMACRHPYSVRRRGAVPMLYGCGDARFTEYGGKCGPDALLWEAVA